MDGDVNVADILQVIQYILEFDEFTIAQQELADEIKVRAEQAKDKTSATTAIIDREDVTKTEDASATETAEKMPPKDEEAATEAVTAESTPGGESAWIHIVSSGIPTDPIEV